MNKPILNVNLHSLPLAAAAGTPANEQKWIQTLQGDAEWIDKQEACRRLREHGTQASIPALQALLADPKLSHMARYALEPMPYPEAGAALRNALPEAGGQARLGIVNSLGIRRDPEAVKSLIPLLKKDDPALTAAAATALAKIGTDPALQTLGQYLKHATGPHKAGAGEAALIAAETLAAQGRTKKAVALLKELHGGAWPSQIQAGAEHTLARIQER